VTSTDGTASGFDLVAAGGTSPPWVRNAVEDLAEVLPNAGHLDDFFAS
jgi:hypothetical protein